MAKEAKIEKYLCDRVKMLGGEVRKVKWIGRRGAPDRLVMLPDARKHVRHDGPKGTTYTNKLIRASATIWVELKAPGKEPEPHQAREHKRMRDMGQRVEVIDSMEGVDNLLKGYE